MLRGVGGEEEEGVMTRQRMTEEEWKAFCKAASVADAVVNHQVGFGIPPFCEEYAEGVLAAHRELVWARKVVEAAEKAKEKLGAHHPVGFTMPESKCCHICKAYNLLKAALAAGEE